MITHKSFFAVFVLVVIMVTHTPADTITRRGTTIALTGCTIRQIEAGRLLYQDARGQTQQMLLEDVRAIGFEGLDALDDAERSFAKNELDRALHQFLLALISAQSDMQRMWVHSRLAAVHNVRGEYIQSAGHVAAVLLHEDHVHWLGIEPTAEVDEPFPAATAEAMRRLAEARRRVRNQQVAAMVNRMIANVQPVHARIDAGSAGDPRTTVSGYTREQIETDVLAAVLNALRRERAASLDDDRSADAVDALINAARWADALALCERIAENPGERDLAQFLHQYGLALRGNGKHLYAAVMFTRCAILYRGTQYAVHSAIAAAEIHREALNDRPAARRLLERAIADADRIGAAELAADAHRMMLELQK